MKNNYLFTFVLMSISLLYSCRSQNSSKVENIIKIDNSLFREISFDQLVDQVSFTPLETNATTLIGSTQKLELYKEDLFLMDGFSSNSVFIFNNEGKLINKISSNGKGPGEYVQLWDIAIDRFNEELLIVDRGGKKILHFDTNGNYKHETALDFYPESIGFVDSNTYLFKTFDKKDPIIITTNNEGGNKKIIKRWFVEFNLQLWNQFSCFDNEQKFILYLNDTIFKAEKSNCLPHYIVNFSDLTMDNTKLMEMKDWANINHRIGYVPKQLAGGIDLFCENDNILIIRFQRKGNSCIYIKLKESKTEFCLENNDEFWNNIFVSLYTIDSSGDLIAKIQPWQFNDLRSTILFNSMKEKIKLVNCIDDDLPIDNNPIIVKIKINKNFKL